jgi:23S rRNA (guanine2445-N2)-methyltransferase / 23S rRNA (guanine2069-N7)-methyltransferase
MSFSFFATTPKALEDSLTVELRSLGITDFKATMAGVAFSGDLEAAYRVCLWSRTANRVLLLLKQFDLTSQHDLYRAVQEIDWSTHFNADESFAVTFSAKNSTVINNSHFGALKVKDAIVDQMREKFGIRPNVETERPHIRVNVRLNGEKAQLSLDLSGESLHRRGYRDVTVDAPIKENLAAAILHRCGWQDLAIQGKTLLDPMCGSGTLLVEAAMIAADYAPALGRNYFGFLGWKQHDKVCWQALWWEANRRKAIGMTNLPTIVGFDTNRQAVNAALSHVKKAGFEGKIHIERRDISEAIPTQRWIPGLVICNPPYGERLGDTKEVALLYEQFGDILKKHFLGWQAGLIISNPELGFRLGIRSRRPTTFYNGALECKLLRLTITENEFFIPKVKDIEKPQAPMFANRLQKNVKKLSKWAAQHHIFCYRVYDADLPEYSAAIDIYQGEKTWVNVQEYEPPKSIEPQKAQERLAGLLAEIPAILNIPTTQLFLKTRRKQRSIQQYEKQNETGIFHQINEGGCQLLVNFDDYLDTGLFLDHRPIRLRLQKEAFDKRFLNLFAYTGSATVHAAVGGAVATTSVDMSNTYLQWAKKNLALNNTKGKHEFIQADCIEWLDNEANTKNGREYDLIFLDPPTFSNSKRMDDIFDVQRDYIPLIQKTLKLLAPDGVLYFSTNFRKFKFDEKAFEHLEISDITKQSIPEDFARDAKVHYCWEIKKRPIARTMS